MSLRFQAASASIELGSVKAVVSLWVILLVIFIHLSTDLNLSIELACKTRCF